jgi:hypothetical protein
MLASLTAGDRIASATADQPIRSMCAYASKATSGWDVSAGCSSCNASGSLSGRAAGDHIAAAAQGQNFGANLSLTTRGNRQNITIHPAGTDVRAVSLALERR